MGDLIAKSRVYLTTLRIAARNRTVPKDSYFTTFSKVLNIMDIRDGDVATQQSLADQNEHLVRLEERHGHFRKDTET